jgi:FAD/FMN-containing dehydrogenase
MGTPNYNFSMKYRHFKSLDELRQHILAKVPTLYVGSKTSTVMPYEKFLERPLDFGLSRTKVIGDLSSMPKKMELDSANNLHIEGPVTWQEAKIYCQTHGRLIMTSPTEELALCLSGVATSATGERSFAYGSVKNQVIDISYLDYLGELKCLKATKNLEFSSEAISAYRDSYAYYKEFKNAPFPRLDIETDLMCGTEGQLGVIVGATFKTVPKNNEIYLFCKLPKWEENFVPHLELYHLVQKFRGKIEACELIDENSIGYLPRADRPAEEHDLIFLEMDEKHFTTVYEELVLKLKHLKEEDFFQMNASKCREFRMQIPRHIFEANQRMGVTKVGTDVQVDEDHFAALLETYKEFKKYNIPYNLFGHFGDAHLHYNFMPTPQQMSQCQKIMEGFYDRVKTLKGSPFAEHGIGVLKRKYIQNFYEDIHYKVFKELKQKYDPDGIFFPDGFLNYVRT